MESKLSQLVQTIPQETVGKAMLASSTAMTGLQMATEFASLIAVAINIVIGLGGVFLMYHKIFDKRRNRREKD